MPHFELPRQIPSQAFGDGSHPTTIACARAVDLICRQRQPRTFLDVGTGTGVLARIARLRGVSDIVGTDIDPNALEAAQRNAALEPELPEIIFTDAIPERCFDLIAANILQSVLISLAQPLTQALAPGGLLLLSGFTRLEVPFIETALSSLRFQSVSYLEEWALLALTKPHISSLDS